MEPAPPLEPRSLTQRLRAWPHWPVVTFVLGFKVLFFWAGTVSFLLPWNTWFTDTHGLLSIWNRWDSLHYLDLAEHGYSSAIDRVHQLAYFPLYPALIRLVAPLAGSFLASAFWISTVCSVAAAVALVRLIRLDHPEDAGRTLFFLFVFPTSHVLHIPYTESLFLALALGSLLCARLDRWELAGLLGACAALTRINGVAVGAALLVEAFAAYRTQKRWRWRWLYVALVPLGGLGYLALNLWVAGDPFAFLKLQHEYFNRPLAWPWKGYAHQWEALFIARSAETLVLRSQELLFGTLMVAGTIVSIVRLRASYAAWMIVNTTLALSFSYPWAVPRYALLLFPLHLLMAQAGRRPVALALMTVWSLLFLAFFSSQFVRGFWAF